MKHIDFHIVVDPNLSVREAHDIIGSIKKDMSEKFKNTRVSIHVDPYQKKRRIKFGFSFSSHLIPLDHILICNKYYL